MKQPYTDKQTRTILDDCIRKQLICINGVCKCSHNLKQVLDKTPDNIKTDYKQGEPFKD